MACPPIHQSLVNKSLCPTNPGLASVQDRQQSMATRSMINARYLSSLQASPSGRTPTDQVWLPRINRSLRESVQQSRKNVSRIILSRTSTSEAVASTGGGDGGRGNGVPRTEVTSEGDDNESADSGKPEEVLVKTKTHQSQLPEDMQDALRRGDLSAADVQAWLNIIAIPVLGWLCQKSAPFRARVLGNPRFLLALGIEMIIGVSAKASAEYQARQERFWQELHFVASDLVLEVIADFSVVWLLSPVKRFEEPPFTGFSRAMALLPGHCLQVGKFSRAQRAATVLYRGLQFFTVGFLSSLVGHGATIYSVDQQHKNSNKAVDPDEKQLAPLLQNSVGWGTFMALSANPRYQLINGIEERVVDVVLKGKGQRSLATVFLRFINTFMGGRMWVFYARQSGLQ